jgi:hypothetical protein
VLSASSAAQADEAARSGSASAARRLKRSIESLGMRRRDRRRGVIAG